jgi:hypothetical protein
MVHASEVSRRLLGLPGRRYRGKGTDNRRESRARAVDLLQVPERSDELMRSCPLYLQPLGHALLNSGGWANPWTPLLVID